VHDLLGTAAYIHPFDLPQKTTVGQGGYSPAVIYLDNAASTRPDPEVVEVMARAARDHFANPSAAHGLGAAAARVIEEARAQLASALGAGLPSEVIFTSGGTEADALGILGPAGRSRGRHLVVSGLEHPAVLRTAEMLVGRGFELTVVAPGPSGVVRCEDLVAALRPDTAVVAVMLVNNEIGTVQPVAEIARAIAAAASSRRADVPLHLHVDAVQAFGFIPLRVSTLGADSVAISGHKFHGPKGTGALWVRQGARMGALWDGGRQERGLRSGTENLPGWVGLGHAAALCVQHRGAGAAARIEQQRDDLERAVKAAVPGARLTVEDVPRAPHISSLAFAGLPAEPLLHALESRGIFASAGSACASRTRGPNQVLAAIGVDDQTAVLRFSLSRETTNQEIAAVAPALREAAAEIAPMAKIRPQR
jgi:cysteine desulfurase